MHKTDWDEVQCFIWVCRGCSHQCEMCCRGKPTDWQDCDGTESCMIKLIVDNGGEYQQGGA